MKTNFISLIVIQVLLIALNAQVSESDSPSTAARIVGELPDGTPTAPEPPKAEFIISAEHIIDSKTIQQGGRKITVQQIVPIALPEPVKVAPSVSPTNPALAERIEAFADENPDAGFLFIGASVYQLSDDSAYSFVNLWPQGQGEAVSFWSSANFAWLSGIGSFIGSDEKSRSIMMAWDNYEIENLKNLTHEIIPYQDLPPLPVLPENKVSFVFTSANPDAETLAGIQSLHDLCQNDGPRLKAAFEGREKARPAQEAELRANPPKPKDLVLRFWRTESPAPTTGGGK